jgi:hypothetical protein
MDSPTDSAPASDRRKWRVELDDRVAVITSTHSESDLLTFDALAELAELLDAASAQWDAVSVVMIRAADGRFLPDVDRDEADSKVRG